MALSKQIEFSPTGFSTPVTVQNAYCKVVKVSGDKKCIEFTVAVFENKDGTAPLYSNNYLFDISYSDLFLTCIILVFSRNSFTILRSFL
jgi:hypothetical protein